MTALPKLLLASQSPRRRQLLEGLGFSFQCASPDIDEGHPTVAGIEAGVMENALRKAQALLPKVTDASTVIISADTLVVLKDRVLTKPVDKADAIAMLRALSGQRHRVVTGMALLSKQFGERVVAEESFVTFKKMSEADIDSYASTSEPFDKAGAYAIQGLGAIFIHGIEGSYTNIMGFPVERFLVELPLFTKTTPFDWF